MRLSSYPLLACLCACNNWPTHEFQLLDTAGYSAELSNSEILSEMVDWRSTVTEEDNNNSSRIGEWLTVGEGWHITGTLDGIGWDSSVAPDFDSKSACEDELAFPPLPKGVYLGDIDWHGILARESGTLCMSLEFDQSTTDELADPLRYDVLLYELNACGEPIEIQRDEDLTVLGLNPSGYAPTWSKGVDSNDILGIVVAGFSPTDLELTVDWQMAISLLDTPSLGTCPTPPWKTAP